MLFNVLIDKSRDICYNIYKKAKNTVFELFVVTLFNKGSLLMYKKVLAAILSLCMISCSFPIECFADSEAITEETGTSVNTSSTLREDETTVAVFSDTDAAASESSSADDSTQNIIESNSDVSYIGLIAIKPKTIDDLVVQQKFRQKWTDGFGEVVLSPEGKSKNVGHGFAAEAGNNLIDQLMGKNVIDVGRDDKPGGADRKIINRDGTYDLIQTKYYNNAQNSVNAGLFLDIDGTYRWKYQENGSFMQLEVPNDQYDKAVDYLADLIKNNKIQGITDPAEASSLLRKGHLTYNQAKNLAKPMTIESLKYDAATGAIESTAAFGIGFVCDYAVCRQLNNYSKEDSAKVALTNSANTAIVSFSSHLISSQLLKSDAVIDALSHGTSNIVEHLGEATDGKAVDALLDATNQNLHPDVKKYKIRERYRIQNEKAVKVLNSSIIANAVTVSVVTLPDVIDLFKQRISASQFSKNLIVAVIGVTGGSLGGYLGGTIASGINPSLAGVGVVAGDLVLGAISTTAADKIMDQFIEDDAVQIYDMIGSAFNQKCDDYMVSEEEAQIVLDGIDSRLAQKDIIFINENDFVKNLYRSDNKEQDIEDFLDPLFVQATSSRPAVQMLSEQEARDIMLDEIGGQQALAIH